MVNNLSSPFRAFMHGIHSVIRCYTPCIPVNDSSQSSLTLLAMKRCVVGTGKGMFLSTADWKIYERLRFTQHSCIYIDQPSEQILKGKYL